jgi:SAM-dependent methyltransferase
MDKDATMMDASEFKWEHTTCDWCGTAASDVVFKGPDRLHSLPGLFCLCRCRQCGVFRQEPRLIWDDLSSYYPYDYAAYKYSSGETNSRLLQVINNYGNVKRRHFVELHQSGGRLLEVGCGTGAFLGELVRSGRWEVEGIEPNQAAADYTASKLGVPIYQGRISEVDLKPASFDAIVLWCVLEHLSQPVQDLRYLHTLLKNGGWLFFSIPNYESLEAKVFGPYWSGWDLPRHLYVFPRPVLRQVLTHIGFSPISERCISTSYHALGHSLEFWSQSWGCEHPKIRKVLSIIYRSWFARLGLLLPLALLDRLNLTTNITFVNQKVSENI